VRIADLYFEKTADRDRPPSDPMAAYFAVFVLTEIPTAALPPTFKALAQRLAARPEPAAQRLAGVARALATGSITK